MAFTLSASIPWKRLSTAMRVQSTPWYTWPIDGNLAQRCRRSNHQQSLAMPHFPVIPTPSIIETANFDGRG